jgi:hypothetical protein
MRSHALLMLLPAIALTAGGPSARASSAPAPVAEEEGDAMPAGIARVGRFDLRDHRPVEGIKQRLGFTLYVEAEESKAAALKAIVKSYEHRLRQEVITIVRLTDPGDFHEPELERFRRRLVLRLRRTMPELGVVRVLIGEFEYLTQ